MGEYEILKALNRYYDHDYQINNSYIFPWESDYFSLAKGSGLAYEVEVKVSRSDYKADFKKRHKHTILANAGREYMTAKTSWRSATLTEEQARAIGYTDPWPERKISYADERHKERHGEYPDRGPVRERIEVVNGFKYVEPFAPSRFYYACPTGLIKKEELPKYAGLLYYTKEGNIRKVKQAPLLHKRPFERWKTLASKFRNKCLKISQDLAEARYRVEQLRKEFIFTGRDEAELFIERLEKIEPLLNAKQGTLL